MGQIKIRWRPEAAHSTLADPLAYFLVYGPVKDWLADHYTLLVGTRVFLRPLHVLFN